MRIYDILEADSLESLVELLNKNAQEFRGDYRWKPFGNPILVKEQNPFRIEQGVPDNFQQIMYIEGSWISKHNIPPLIKE